MQTRAVLRVAFIVLFTALAAIMNGCDIVLPWHPFATVGFTADRHGAVRSIDSVAEAHGLHLGDRIDIGRLAPPTRLDLSENDGTSLPVGATENWPLASGNSIGIPIHAYPRSLFLNVSDITCVVSLWIAIGVAAFLVLIRPTRATWAFYVFSFWVCSGGTVIFALVPNDARVVITLIRVISATAACAEFFSFALRFPDVRPAGVVKVVERAVLWFLAPALALVNAGFLLAFEVAGVATPPWVGALGGLTIALFAAGVVTLFARYATADEQHRSRLRWVVAAFSVAYLPYLGAAPSFSSRLSRFRTPCCGIDFLIFAWSLVGR